MSTPPLMVGAGLLFWGLQADLMHFAIPMAIILEGARWARWRWEFTDNDFNRLTDLSSLLFILAALYLFSREGAHGVFAIATWLPLLLFLLLASQKYSSRGDIGITALFLGLRRMEARGVKVPRRRIDLTYPYFSTCLIASAMTNPTSPWFFPGAMILTAWALLGIRPHRYPLGLWLLLITLAGMLGYFGQMGLRAAQLELEEIVLSWFEGRLWNRTDPYRSSTAIGHIGRLKFSDRIILQVKRPNSAVGPLLLRQASYRNYSFGTWSVGKAPFEILPRGGEIGTWILAPEKLDGESITVSGYMQDGNGLLALPGGGYRIENLPAVALKRNPFGAVKMDEGPGFAAFRVHFQPSLSTDHSPQKTDLRIPERQRPTIERIIRELKFVDKPPGEILEATGEFFQDNFSYSLFSRAAVGNSTPLSSFLLTKRQGHCEYFASATVLLLRAAGIPARYATGFSAQEYDPLTGTYVVRKRHAHAWALAYIDGNWVDVDFTPTVWAGLEEEHAPWWEPIYDLFSRANFAFQRWLWRDKDEQASDAYIWLLAPLLLILSWRLYRQKKVRRQISTTFGDIGLHSSSGRNRPFALLIAQLDKLGAPRRPGETVKNWLTRLTKIYGREAMPDRLSELLSLHYRYRFDPAGISKMEQRRMVVIVDTWLNRELEK